MSTKMTIVSNEQYHLYTNVFDEDNIKLQVLNPTCLTFDSWERGSIVTLTIPRDDLIKIAQGFLEKKDLFLPDKD
jgi:hypothetical protein